MFKNEILEDLFFIDAQDDWSAWWRYFDQEAEFFNCTQTLDDCDIIAIGPHEFQIIYTLLMKGVF